MNFIEKAFDNNLHGDDFVSFSADYRKIKIYPYTI